MLTAPSESKADAHWRRAEVLTAGLITLWIVVLHVVYLFHAGPLWRDEADSVDFAGMPTMAEIWRNLHNDISPPLFVAVARVWALAGLNSDFDYRLLGFFIGIVTLGVFWWCARKLGDKSPLLALSLYAANQLAIRVGDDLRPYGLGIALMLLATVMMWRFVHAPGRGTFLWAALTATLSVQCLYQNSMFILAIACGAWMVTLPRREWKTALQTGTIGLIAALSLLPYWFIVTEGQISVGFRRQQVHFDEIWNLLDAAMEVSGKWMMPVWLGLITVGLVMAVIGRKGPRRRELEYCGAVLVAGTAFYLLFLRVLGLPPHLWYFLILMAPAALMLDAILGAPSFRWAQAGRMVLSLILIAASVPVCYAGACLRQSNIDLIAAKLKADSQPGDLILVSPWYYGVSLHRHFDASQWITLPPLDDVRIHRYDLVKKAMMTENPIGPLLDKIRAALRSGHKLWVVGTIREPPNRDAPPVLPPYDGIMEQSEGRYFSNWEFQIGYLVETHAVEGGRVEVPVPGNLAVNSVENIPLRVIRGWRD